MVELRLYENGKYLGCDTVPALPDVGQELKLTVRQNKIKVRVLGWTFNRIGTNATTLTTRVERV